MRAVRLFVAGAVAVLAATVGLSAPASATTVPVPVCAGATFTTAVTNRPDSGLHGNWAKDTFTRTTAVLCIDGGYRINLSDTGSFTTLAGALSPSAGVPIHDAPFTGSFVGGMTLTVKSETGPVDPGTSDAKAGKYSSSEWAALVFPKGKITVEGWGWTYKHCGETWVNAAAGNSGDITGTTKCPPKPTTTTPAPTTKTTPPVTTTVTPAPVVISNPGQFQTVPNVSKGVDTGDGSLS